MKRLLLILPLILLAIAACKSEKKYVRYATLYEETPRSIHVAPLFDLTPHKKDADSATLCEYQRQAVAAHFFNQTIPIGIRQRGYAITTTDSILYPGIRTARRLKSLQDGDPSRYCVTHDADAILICSLLAWKGTPTEPRLYAEYQLRSTKSGRDLMHSWVRVSRLIDTAYNGQLLTLPEERTIADDLQTDIVTAIHCYMVQQANVFIMQDIPFAPSSYFHGKDLYLKATKQYFKAIINSDGTLEIEPFSLEEFENECFL